MGIVPQEKVAHFVGGGVGEYKHARKTCIGGCILHEI
jgi:predicted oxidoreductase